MEFWDELNLKYDEKLEETKKSLAFNPLLHRYDVLLYVSVSPLPIQFLQ